MHLFSHLQVGVIKFYWPLSMYSVTLSMVDLDGSNFNSKSKKVYDISFLTWRNFIRKCFWIISNSFQSELKDDIAHSSTP